MKRWQAFLVTAIVLAILAVGIWLLWKPLMSLLDLQSVRLQSADSLVALIIAAFSLASGIFSFLSKRKEDRTKPTSPTSSINTGGGAFVGGNVNTEGGDFTGRDSKRRD